MSTLADYIGQTMPERINIWWYSSEAKQLFCLEQNQSVYSAVESQIYMLEKYLAAHGYYKDVVELDDGNDIMSKYQIYRVQMKCYYLCTALFIRKGEYTQPHGLLAAWNQLKYYYRVELKT